MGADLIGGCGRASAVSFLVPASGGIAPGLVPGNPVVSLTLGWLAMFLGPVLLALLFWWCIAWRRSRE